MPNGPLMAQSRAVDQTGAVTSSPTPEEVAAFVEMNVVPPRREQPRLADALASVERHMVSSRQGSVAAWRVGDGPAVLLVHGYADDHSLWSMLMDTLIARGRPFVALDLPGHGFSEGRWGLRETTVDGVLAVAEALGPVDGAVSHSAGSGPLLQALDEGMEVHRLVFIAPPFGGSDFWVRHGERHGASAELVEAARAAYEAAVGRERAAFDWQEMFLALDQEILVVHSVDDERFDVTDTAEFVNRYPQVRLVTVDGLSHRRTARDPRAVEVVADFVCRS